MVRKLWNQKSGVNVVLAYEINDFRDGYYQLIKVNAELAAVEEFNRLAKISEDIIRHIAVKDEK